MREILFKAKRVDNGEWVEGLLWKKKYNDGNRIFISCFPDKDDNEEVYVVCPETVSQFTGLHDTNGKRIFEGDIVANWDYYEEKIGKYRGVILYGILNCGCCYSVYGFSACDKYGNAVDEVSLHGNENCAERAVVIGNHFDNPELLEQKR